MALLIRFLGGVEPPEALPKSAATVTFSIDSGEHCLELMKVLINGFDLEMKGDLTTLTPVQLLNRYGNDGMHPTHVRSMSFTMILASEKGLGLDKVKVVPIAISIIHKQVQEAFDRDSAFRAAHDFFFDRMLNMSQKAFDEKFEFLLSFLVEAIGVPVLLSMLLLTYAC